MFFQVGPVSFASYRILLECSLSCIPWPIQKMGSYKDLQWCPGLLPRPLNSKNHHQPEHTYNICTPLHQHIHTLNSQLRTKHRYETSLCPRYHDPDRHRRPSTLQRLSRRLRLSCGSVLCCGWLRFWDRCRCQCSSSHSGM
jgi:hypothetical protein